MGTSVIGGGNTNCIESEVSGIFSGGINWISPNSHVSNISGGSRNCILDEHSFIGGGRCNTVSAAYSSILGGSGNTIAAAFTHSAVFGCNVNAVIGCAVHSNNFVAQDMSDQSVVGLPTGTLYYCNATNVVYRTP